MFVAFNTSLILNCADMIIASPEASLNMPDKKRILLIGSGGVGTMAAFSLESSGLASVTAVLRSNYEAVSKNGFNIKSVDYGTHVGWKPTEGKSSHPSLVQVPGILIYQ